MATLIGKVGIVMKGDYNSANTYEVLDAVSYNGGLYVAKQAVPANTLPTNTTYWQKAIDAASVISNALDGLSLSQANNNAANIIVKTMGNNTTFKLQGNFSLDQSILLFAAYPSITDQTTNFRGLYSIDKSGNIINISSTSGFIPTASVNTEKTEMTITLPYGYGFVYILSYRPLTFAG